MRRRTRVALAFAGAAALLGLLALGLRIALPPDRVARLLLERTGRALGLEIVAPGRAELRLRGTPTLVVRELVVRQPGAPSPLLRAERVLLSLPWSTIRARGTDLTVTRVELDAPVLDLPALERWLQTRPETERRIPTLTSGFAVTGGTLHGADWRIEAFDLAAPLVRPGTPLRARVSGRYRGDGLALPFALALHLREPAFDTAFGAAGEATLQGADWALPARVRLSAQLRVADGWALARPRLSAAARYRGGDGDIPFAFGLAATELGQRDERLLLPDAHVVVHGTGTIPDLRARGGLALDHALRLRLAGALPRWPQAWPALPPPLAQSTTPLPFVLDYRGPADLSGVAALALRRGQSRFDGRFRLPELTAWLESDATGTPLPPLAGRVSAPRLDVDDIRLEGVRIEFEDPALPARE